MIFIKGIAKANVDMAALLREAKEKQRQELEASIEHNKKPSVEANNSSEQPHTVQHGGVVEMEDGTTAIVINHEEELRKIQSVDKTRTKLMGLATGTTLVSDENQEIVIDENGNHVDPGEEWLRKNPFDVRAGTVRTLKEEFSKLTYGFKGLVPVGSEEGRIVEEAFGKVRSGEIILPSPEEYMMQKRAAEQRKKDRMQRLLEKAAQKQEKKQAAKQTPKPKKQKPEEPPSPATPESTIDADSDDLQMAEAPKYAIIQKGVIEQLMETETKTINTPTAEVVEARPRKMTPVVAEPVETVTTTAEVEPHTTREPVMDQAVVVSESENPEVIEPTVVKQQPIDMFKIQEELEERRAAAAQVQPEPEEADETIEQPDIMHVTVPEGGAKEFAQNMPKELYEKFQASKSVQIEEVELKSIPSVTKRITDIADYRKVCNVRPTYVAGELAERVLLNSGIVIILKSATSIEMASMYPNSPRSTDEYDLEKVFRFIYRHTVDTSIGKLSYNEFKDTVSPLDVNTALEGIYSISEQAERTVLLNCVTDDDDPIPGCGGGFEYKIKTNSLPDPNSLPEESVLRLKEIINARNNFEDAKRIQETSPASTVKVAKIGDRYIFVRSTTARRAIEIDAKSEKLKTYPMIVPHFLTVVDSIRIESETEVSCIDTVELLAEEIAHMSDTELEMLRQFAANIKEYRTMTFSIKGPYTCPLCGKVYKNAELSTMMTLIFQIARAMS